MTELAPNFEAVLMPHDGIMPALVRINSKALLPVDVARTVLIDSQKFPYAPVKAASGKPYAQISVDGVLKHFYIFANPEDPTNPQSMLALQCTVRQDKSGVIVVMPEHLLRGPEADVVFSVKYGCCTAGGRTMVYSDTGTDGTSFLRTAFSGADVRPEIQQIWRNLKVVTLDDAGMASLAHLADDLRGTCGGHNHGLRPDYRQGGSWGARRFTCS